MTLVLAEVVRSTNNVTDATVSHMALPSIISDYTRDLPKVRREKIERVADIVCTLFPSVEVSMEYNMPTFRVGENWFCIGNQKHYCSVYTCSPELIAPYIEAHPSINHGKGCLRFRDTVDIDEEAMKRVVELTLGASKKV